MLSEVSVHRPVSSVTSSYDAPARVRSARPPRSLRSRVAPKPGRPPGEPRAGGRSRRVRRTDHRIEKQRHELLLLGRHLRHLAEALPCRPDTPREPGDRHRDAREPTEPRRDVEDTLARVAEKERRRAFALREVPRPASTRSSEADQPRTSLVQARPSRTSSCDRARARTPPTSARGRTPERTPSRAPSCGRGRSAGAERHATGPPGPTGEDVGIRSFAQPSRRS